MANNPDDYVVWRRQRREWPPTLQDVVGRRVCATRLIRRKDGLEFPRGTVFRVMSLSRKAIDLKRVGAPLGAGIVMAVELDAVALIDIYVPGTPGHTNTYLYWRELDGEWHCYVRQGPKSRDGVSTFASLCRVDRREGINGQHRRRPASALRCPECDREEARRRKDHRLRQARARRTVSTA